VKEAQMAAVEERVSYLEAKMEDVSTNIAELKAAIVALDGKMDQRFDRVEDRFYWVIGIQFGILIAVIGGLVGIVTKLL
jgi:uncharacterized coiled-coil protein SlyX